MVLKFTISRSMLSYLRSMELTDVSINATATLAKEKQNKMVFSTKDLVLIKVLRQVVNKKVTTIDE